MAITKAERLAVIERTPLSKGAHSSRSDGMCLLEMVAYFAGRSHSDHPPCVSPAIAAFGRAWNDALDDEQRQVLKPYIFRMAGTATNDADELRRAWMATDWLVRTFAPAWLDLAGLTEHATNLRALPELTSDVLAVAAQSEIEAADSAAYSAADSTAYSTARSAAYSALAQTVAMLQKEALLLLDRMCAVGRETVAAC